MSTDIVNDYYRSQVESAEKGSTSAARKILREYCEAIADGQTPNVFYLRYLADCFSGILNDVKPSKALGLEEGNRRSNAEERFQAALKAARYHRNGHSLSKAFNIVAIETSMKCGGIKAAYYKHQRVLDAAAELIERHNV